MRIQLSTNVLQDRTNLLKTIMAKYTKAQMQKSITENAKDPAGTTNPQGVPLKACIIAPRDQAIPTPRNTLTELLPVMFPIELSAVSSLTADIMLAKVSAVNTITSASSITHSVCIFCYQ